MQNYFNHRVEVDLNDFVQVANDDSGDLLEHFEVELGLPGAGIRFHKLVKSDRSQVAHRDLQI